MEPSKIPVNAHLVPPPRSLSVPFSFQKFQVNNSYWPNRHTRTIGKMATPHNPAYVHQLSCHVALDVYYSQKCGVTMMNCLMSIC